ncbi:MAG: hypothetical protein QXZ23_12680, partial [Saccharolobus sp.]
MPKISEIQVYSILVKDNLKDSSLPAIKFKINGKYFIMWRKDDKEDRSCLNSQLLGQFWCDALGLPPITDEEK